MTELLRAPSGRRDARAYEWTRRRTLDALAGRTVWCADPRLRGYLRWVGESGVTAFALEMPEHYESADVVVPRVRAADIVVLNAPPTHALARAIRDRGAHALWQIDSLRDRADGIDAYVLTGRAADGAQIVAAIMPSAGLVALKEMRGDPYRELGWGSLLADVVRADRDECVGGTLRPRPLVAAR